MGYMTTERLFGAQANETKSQEELLRRSTVGAALRDKDAFNLDRALEIEPEFLIEDHAARDLFEDLALQ